MKIKITVEEPAFTNQLLVHLDKKYKSWVDFTVFHCNNANVKIDIYQFIEDIHLAIFHLKYEKQAKLFYPQTGIYKELDFWVLRLIKRRIYKLSRQEVKYSKAISSFKALFIPFCFFN